MRATGSRRRPRRLGDGTRAIVAIRPIEVGNPFRFGRGPTLSRRAGALSGQAAPVLLAGPAAAVPAPRRAARSASAAPLREGI